MRVVGTIVQMTAGFLALLIACRLHGRSLVARLDHAGLKQQRLLERVNDITRQFPGNIYVLRALRAIPILREVRMASSEMVAERIADAMIANGHKASRERLIASARLTTELAYSAMEMVLEEPDRDAHQICTDVSRMIATHYAQLTD